MMKTRSRGNAGDQEHRLESGKLSLATTRTERLLGTANFAKKTRNSVKTVARLKTALTGKEGIPYQPHLTANTDFEHQENFMIRNDESPTEKAIQEEQSQPFEISPLNRPDKGRFDTSELYSSERPSQPETMQKLYNAVPNRSRRDGVQVFHTASNSMSQDISISNTSEFHIEKNDPRNTMYINEDCSPGIEVVKSKNTTPTAFRSRKQMALQYGSGEQTSSQNKNSGLLIQSRVVDLSIENPKLSSANQEQITTPVIVHSMPSPLTQNAGASFLARAAAEYKKGEKTDRDTITDMRKSNTNRDNKTPRSELWMQQPVRQTQKFNSKKSTSGMNAEISKQIGSN